MGSGFFRHVAQQKYLYCVRSTKYQLFFSIEKKNITFAFVNQLQMGCPKLTYNLTAEPRLRVVYNAADEEEKRVIQPIPEPVIWRIYTADEDAPRLYMPENRLYIVCEEIAPGVYRYSYCRNNPLIYTDPSGEFIWAPVFIGAMLYSHFNLAIHCANGDVKSIGNALNYYAMGAINGAIAGAVGVATCDLGFAGIASKSFWAKIGGGSLLGAKGINIISTASSLIGGNADHAVKIMMGKAYVDNWGQALLRHSWEGLQSWAGYNFTQFRNTIGHVDRVDYAFGATWATRENYKRGGISIGNYINMKIKDEITTSFEERVLSDPWFMQGVAFI